jgi:hypothetical protein
MTCRRSTPTQLAFVALALAVLVAGGFSLTAAAERDLTRVEGRVQWIAAEKMMVVPRTGGLPLSVDLTQVPQDQYAGVLPGSRVSVEGVIADDARRVIATSVKPLDESVERITLQPPSPR